MIAWYYLIKWTGYEIGYAAWGVGCLTGIGARVVGCKECPALGFFAGLCALIAIVGGQYLAVKFEADKYFDDMARSSYDERMAYAKQAVEAKTDEQIKALLAEDVVGHREKSSSQGVTADEIKDFRDNELPALKSFIDGKPSREQFENGMLKVKSSISYNLMLLKASVGWFTLLWLFLGIGSAYKIASGESDD
jgi:hypothetical protein